MNEDNDNEHAFLDRVSYISPRVSFVSNTEDTRTVKAKEVCSLKFLKITFILLLKLPG